MQFNSYSFLLLLIPYLVLFWSIPNSWRRAYLLATSLLFYASWNVVYAPLPLFVCGLAWFCGRRMLADRQSQGSWLRLGIYGVLAILVFFKYRQFLLDNLNVLLTSVQREPIRLFTEVALPLGISFYTFEAISYLIDTWQGRVKKVEFIDLSLFVSFWPHLIAGPIVRVRELVPQLHAPKRFDIALLVRGLDRLLWGLVMKNVFANNLGAMVDEGFLPQAAAANSTLDNWFLAVAFGLQIYFDFAAYSSMAIGASHLMGITLPENFRFPYHAANPSDFWQRWHMTLSRWIRDYLFFPINAKYKGAPRMLYISLLGIMALVGLWHGAGWGFILWGVMHGFYLVLFRMWEFFVEKHPALAKPVWARAGWQLLTLAGVIAAWVPFRALTLDQSATMLKSMFFGFRFQASYSVNFYLLTLALALFCVVEPWLAARMEKLEKKMAVTSAGLQTHFYLVRPLLYAAGLFLFLLFDDRDTQFIYFQF